MVTLIQPSFAKGEVDPELFGRVDTAAYKIGLATNRNNIIRTSGGAMNRAGLKQIGFATNNAYRSRLRRFRFNTTDTYMLEFSNFTMRVIRDDAFVTETPKAISGATAANPAVLTVAAHGFAANDAIQVSGVAGMTRLNDRWFNVGSIVDANHFTLLDPITGANLDSTAYAAYSGGGAVARVYTLATPYAAADTRILKFIQSADTMTITHPLYDEMRLTRTGDAAWTITTANFVPNTTAPTGVTLTPNVTGSVSVSYLVTSTNSNTGEESLASVIVTIGNGANPADNTVAWAAVAGVTTYSVYKAINGVFGFVGDTPNLSFTDKNTAPSLGNTPPLARNPFLGAGNRPGCSGYYQQRQVRGGSLNAPDTEYFSQTGRFYNMSVSQPSSESDAITATLTSGEVNEIRHFVAIKDLIVFTSGAEWRVTANGVGLSSSTYSAVPQSTWGCSNLEPIVIGLTTLFVPENQISVRTARYTFQSDTYTGEDLTVLSAHLYGQYQMVAWASGKLPDPVIISVRSDGQATCLTYQEEQQVTAWARWDTSGFFEDVAIVRPNLKETSLDDVAYFEVRRTVKGRQVRFIERMHSRRFYDIHDCFFVDCGRSYDKPIAVTGITLANPVVITAPAHGLAPGQKIDLFDAQWVPVIDDEGTESQPDQLNRRRFVIASATADTVALQGVDGSAMPNAYVSGGAIRVPISVVTGADHLEGRKLAVLADGNVVQGMVVQNGSFTLPFEASRIHYGLGYISDIETLDLEPSSGTIQGKTKRETYAVIRVNKSRGLFVGGSLGNLTEIKQRQFEDIGDPVALASQDFIQTFASDWNPHGRVFIRQMYPLPMDVLAIVPSFDIEDG